MTLTGVDPPTVAYPNLVAVAERRMRLLFERPHLQLEFFRAPFIVGIQKSDGFALSSRHAAVTCRADASPVLIQIASSTEEG